MLVPVIGEGARLTHQAIDDVTVVDRMLSLARKPRHALNVLIAVIDVDRIGIDDDLDLLADQTTWHRVNVFQHTNGAAGRDTNATDPPATIELRRRQIPHGRLFFAELLFAGCVATVLDLLDEFHVLFY